MNRRDFLGQTLALPVIGGMMGLPSRAAVASSLPASASGWNVLVILCDSLGPSSHSVGQSSPVLTPNLERLARRGTWFSRGYCDAPGCGPSRTALLTGVHAARSGVYYNNQAFRRANSWIAQVLTMPEQFRANGYLTAGYGFIAHHRGTDEDRLYSPNCYRIFDREGQVRWTEDALMEKVIPGTRVKTWAKAWDWGVLPDDWDRDDPAKWQQDTEFAQHTCRLVEQKHDQPFFATCGFWRPHVAWTVPQRYFDRFPLDRVELPEGYREGDLNDVPQPGRWLATHRGEHAYIRENGLWKKCLQAYYASVAYMDEQVGHVLDALDRGPNRDNTIVVFASDHGWHSGEKEHWSKFDLWEQACRVPLGISIPGGVKQTVSSPVSLLDLYPTLLSLCGLPQPATHALDGVDLGPLLRGTAKRPDRELVLNTYGRGNHATCDERFRYIRYQNGEEELYDHDRDPWEWENLAAKPSYAEHKARLARGLPVANAPDIQYASGRLPLDGNGWIPEAFQPGAITSKRKATSPKAEEAQP